MRTLRLYHVRGYANFTTANVPAAGAGAVAAVAAAASTSAPGATAGGVVSACAESDLVSEELSANGITASVGCGTVSLGASVASENTSMRLEQLRLLVYGQGCQSRDFSPAHIFTFHTR